VKGRPAVNAKIAVASTNPMKLCLPIPDGPRIRAATMEIASV